MSNDNNRKIEQEIAVWPELSNDAVNKVSIINDIINVITNDSEVDPAAILFTLLCGFGAAVGSVPHVKIGDTNHSSRLNSVLVGSSSRARKGTSERPIRILLDLAHKRAGIEQLTITPGPLSSGEGLIYSVRDACKDGSQIDPGVHDKRILCVESEFANVFRACKREGNTLSCTIRTVWDGGTISPLTKNNRICATDPHICILGHITHEELNHLLNNTETWNGFANRFLWVCVQRKKTIPLPMPMNESIVLALADELGKILVFARGQRDLNFTSKAKALWNEKYFELSRDIPGKLGVVTSRAEAQTIRIALTCALIDAQKMIDVHHLEASIAIWQYCNDSAKFLFGHANADPDLEKILQSLSTHPMTTSELHELFNGHKKAADLNKLLMQLQMSGKVIGEQAGGGYGKGKGATTWSIVTKR
jgi:hypothetical protein